MWQKRVVGFLVFISNHASEHKGWLVWLLGADAATVSALFL
jgi:hypothetical protein